MQQKVLFVWEGVLRDYTAGIVCVFAKNETCAWELLKKKDYDAWWILRGEPENRKDPRTPRQLGRDCVRPKRVTRASAFVVWGGG